MRWLLAILLALMAIAAPGTRTTSFAQAAIGPVDSIHHPCDLPAPSFELRRPSFTGSSGDFRPVLSLAEHVRILPLLRPRAGARDVMNRTRPRRHVPRMSSAEPDPLT